MKTKHISLIALVVSGLLIGVAVWLERVVWYDAAGVAPLAPMAPLSELKAPPRADLEQMDFLERRLGLLSSPPPRMMQQADLSALGYVPLSPSRSNGPVAGASAQAASKYRLTLAFDGSVKRYCIIDDQLYPEGAVLPDGATIMKIESRRVLIAKESLRQWLDIEAFADSEVPEES